LSYRCVSRTGRESYTPPCPLSTPRRLSFPDSSLPPKRPARKELRQNAPRPVTSCPRISACTSCVPS